MQRLRCVATEGHRIQMSFASSGGYICVRCWCRFSASDLTWWFGLKWWLGLLLCQQFAANGKL